MGQIKNKAGEIIGWEQETMLPAGDGEECGSGVVISHGVFIFESHRGKGAGSWAHQERLQRWKKEGHVFALCTVREDNAVQRRILEKNSWAKLAEYRNPDGDTIFLMGRVP